MGICSDLRPRWARPNRSESRSVMKVLILCTGNSARSQMAEGLLRSLSHGAVEVHSAGTHPSQLNPLAIEAMKEVGIDISGHRSKSVDEFAGQRFDVVITVCDNARESCPIFPGAPERLHWSYPDPAAVVGSHHEKLRAFREVRDGLRQKLRAFLDSGPTA
jgi:arsenate reductase